MQGFSEELDFDADVLDALDADTDADTRVGDGDDDGEDATQELLLGSPTVSATKLRSGIDALQVDATDAEDVPTEPASLAPTAPRLAVRREMATKLPFVFSDLAALAVCGAAGYGVTYLMQGPEIANAIRWTIGVALLPFIASFCLSGLYAGYRVQPVSELRRLIRANLIVLLALAIGVALNPPLRICFMTIGAAALAVVPFSRAIMRRWCSRRSWWGFPALIIGHGQAGSAIAHVLIRNPKAGLRPAALSDPDGHCRISFVPVVNDFAKVQELVENESIRHAVLAMPEANPVRLAEVIEQYGAIIPHLLVIPGRSRMPGLLGLSGGCGRIDTAEIRNGSGLFTHQLAKRMLDLAIVMVAGVVLLPVLAVISLLVKLTSRGPIVFAHTRIGRGGRPVRVLKFRTMRRDSQSALREYLAKNPEAKKEWDETFKLQNDPRVTRIGKFLRSTSLDELPQIWNVIRGEMSVVGPRPIVNEEIARYGSYFKFYAAVKPGITGLWQVCGRNDTTYEQRVRIDEYYVRNWSPWLDLYVIARTAITLIRRTGAY